MFNLSTSSARLYQPGFGTTSNLKIIEKSQNHGHFVLSDRILKLRNSAGSPLFDFKAYFSQVMESCRKHFRNSPSAVLLRDVDQPEFINAVAKIMDLVNDEEFWQGLPFSQNRQGWTRSQRPRIALFGYNYLLFEEKDGHAVLAQPTLLDEKCHLLTLALEKVLKEKKINTLTVDMVSDLPHFENNESVKSISEYVINRKQFPPIGLDLIKAFNHSRSEILNRSDIGLGLSSQERESLTRAERDKMAENLLEFQKGNRILFASERSYKNGVHKLLSEGFKKLPPNWSLVDDVDNSGQFVLRFTKPNVRPAENFDIPIARKRRLLPVIPV